MINCIARNVREISNRSPLDDFDLFEIDLCAILKNDHAICIIAQGQAVAILAENLSLCDCDSPIFAKYTQRIAALNFYHIGPRSAGAALDAIVPFTFTDQKQITAGITN